MQVLKEVISGRELSVSLSIFFELLLGLVNKPAESTDLLFAEVNLLFCFLNFKFALFHFLFLLLEHNLHLLLLLPTTVDFILIGFYFAECFRGLYFNVFPFFLQLPYLPIEHVSFGLQCLLISFIFLHSFYRGFQHCNFFLDILLQQIVFLL